MKLAALTKHLMIARVGSSLLLTTGVSFASDPLLDSWYTQSSGKYARVYQTTSDQSSGTAVTTWSRGGVNQTLPAYSGVSEIDYSTTWVYLRTTGLGFHNMGPWYLDANKTQLFPNLPGNTATLWRFPRVPGASSANNLTSLGTIGFFVDGVAMFDGEDGYSWNGTADVTGQNNALWIRDAYPEEGVSFDAANAHQEQTGTYHYHADPVALRAELGDNVTFNAATKKWVENATTPTNHSPIVGWVRDGYPIYGPYGYSSPMDPTSGIRRMTTGYVLRNGQNGTVNLASTGRITLPAWGARAHNHSASLSASEYGPTVAGVYTIGRYHEDYEYLGDLGKTQGTDFDLDEHNGRFCVTPEFPSGTYAYFLAINSTGTPVFPYNTGRIFYGNPTGGPVTTISETVTTNFVGGPNVPLQLSEPAVQEGTVTLTWSAAEGGTYRVDGSTNLASGSWATVNSNLAPSANLGSTTVTSANAAQFYRVARTALASYSTTSAYTSTNGSGGQTGTGITSVSPTSANRGQTFTLTINLDSTANPPPQNAPINSITVGTISGTSLVHVSQTQATASITIPQGAATGSQTVSIVFPGPPTNQSQTVTFTLSNGFTIN